MAKVSSSTRVVRRAEMASLDSVVMRLRLIEGVSPGSYQHAALSARLLSDTKRLMGKKAEETQEALEGCVEAHIARYGRVSAATLARLVDAHENNALVDLMSE